MIAKILKHSKSFAGVDYNRQKLMNGKAELLEVKNFDLQDIANMKGHADVSFYLDYLDYLGNIRQDVKYRQFHAVISAKGKSMSGDQLLMAARMYLDKMGFSGQPYMVFFHKDTDNNHVHIISSMVRKDGTLVAYGNDRYNSIKAMREINQAFGIAELPTLEERAENDIKVALQWKFAYEQNFADILAMSGYRMQKSEKEENTFDITYDGESCGKVTKAQLDACKKAYSNGISVRINNKLDPSERPEIYTRKQLLFKKLTEYASKEYSLDEIKSLQELRKQLGFHIESSVSVDKDGKEHLRCSIIDYPGKTIFKGSDVFPFETLTRSDAYRNEADHFYNLVNQILKEEGTMCPWRLFAKRMTDLGYKMHADKDFICYATKAGSRGQFHIPQQTVAALFYNQRAANVREMDIHSEYELLCLAAIHHVKVDDVRPERFAQEDKQMRKQCRFTLASIFNNYEGKDLVEHLKAEKVAFVLFRDGMFCYHPKGGLYNMKQLETDLDREHLQSLGILVLDVERTNRNYSKWMDYLNERTVTYPEHDTRQSDGTGQRFAETDEDHTERSRSEEKNRADDFGQDQEQSASPSMDAILEPVSLSGILEVFAQIAMKMRTHGGGGSGRKRKRKKSDDDDD